LRPGSRRKTKNPAKNCRRCRSWENTAMTSLRGSLLRDFLLMTHTKRQSLIGSVLREYAIFVEGFKIAWALVGRYWSLTSSRRIPQASGQPQDSTSVMSYRRLPSSEQSRRPVSQYFIFLYLTHSPPLSPPLSVFRPSVFEGLPAGPWRNRQQQKRPRITSGYNYGCLCQ